jgi:hypothetical protein
MTWSFLHLAEILQLAVDAAQFALHGLGVSTIIRPLCCCADENGDRHRK